LEGLETRVKENQNHLHVRRRLRATMMRGESEFLPIAALGRWIGGYIGSIPSSERESTRRASRAVLRFLERRWNGTMLHTIHTTNPGLSQIEARVLSCNIGVMGSHRNAAVTAARSQMLAGRGSGPAGTTATTPSLFMTIRNSLRTMGKGTEFGRVPLIGVSRK
jgi:hypothetical protein